MKINIRNLIIDIALVTLSSIGLNLVGIHSSGLMFFIGVMTGLIFPWVEYVP